MSQPSYFNKSQFASSASNQEERPRVKKRMQKWSHKRSILHSQTIPKEEFRSRSITFNDPNLSDSLEYLRAMQNRDYKSQRTPQSSLKSSTQVSSQKIPIIVTGVIDSVPSHIIQPQFQPSLIKKNSVFINSSRKLQELISFRVALHEKLMRTFLTVMSELKQPSLHGAVTLPLACSQIGRVILDLERVSSAISLLRSQRFIQ